MTDPGTGGDLGGELGGEPPQTGDLPPEGPTAALNLRPVRAGNGFEEALEQVLQALRLGLVPVGHRLPPERELAGRLGVSRAVLRDVLGVLAAEDLLEGRRGRYGGWFVLRDVPFDAAPVGDLAAEVADVLAVRGVLETGAAELCAARGLGGADARRLLAALAAAGDAPPQDYRRRDTLLHLCLVELAGSPTLSAEYAAVRARLNDLLGRIPVLVRNLEHAQRQHTALCDAVLAGDAARARTAAAEHCAGTAALLRGFLR